MMGEMPLGLLGVSSCNELDNWRYYIAVASSQAIKSDLEEYIVPSSTWAIFSGEGSNYSIQELEKRIVTEWLSTSGYEYGNAPDIEVYYPLIVKEPQNVFWGGYHAYFADLDGYYWEVVWVPNFESKT